MPLVPVIFTFAPGITSRLATRAMLKGSWDAAGRYSEHWSTTAMREERGTDGCPSFTAAVEFDAQQVGWLFRWGVEVDTQAGSTAWAIMSEENLVESSARVRLFRLGAPGGPAQHEIYCLNHSRRLGAQKFYRPDQNGDGPAIRFSVWAPNATAVDVCIGNLWRSDDPSRTSLIDPARLPPDGTAIASAPRHLICGGYISDADTSGVHPWGPFPLLAIGAGVWASNPDDPVLARFGRFDHVPYMFRVTKSNGVTAYRTDLFSRCQIGYGTTRPEGPYEDPTTQLDGSVSCSVVIDPDRVTTEFSESLWPETRWTPQAEFFAAPAPGSRPVPSEIRDLVIYELHVGALGASTRRTDEPGTLEDALALLDYLEELGVNAVELLPLSEHGGGGAGWGYSTSHYLALEYSGGGRDQYKWFIRECHRRGIAVVLDVVYNHYSHNAERAEWMYDTDAHNRNAYYWYEGRPDDYAQPDGGYLDNVSTAWAPRYHQESVRAMFTGSAIALATEFQIDGFRVDQTTSVHSYNVLHANGRPVSSANVFGAKLLRELTRSLKFVNPRIMLMAEDHSNWDGVTRSPDDGGLGFDATWYADFYHHLVGDTQKGSDYAKLIKTAGFGDDRPLAMDYFAGALQATGGGRKVVYHESHDEAGNGELTDRTIAVAVDGAPLLGETRRFAEARCRFAAGVTLLSAGIPMFLFGEEVGSDKKFVYGRVLENREDLVTVRDGSGRFLFDFYKALIRLRLSRVGLRSHNIDVVLAHNDHRLLVFRRWGEGEEFLVVASLNNRPFDDPGYLFRAARIPTGRWREIFNSDAAAFGGWNVGNAGATLTTEPGLLHCVVPANGFLVFERVASEN